MAGTESLKLKLNELAVVLRADHLAAREPEPENETQFWAMSWIWADHIAARWTRTGDFRTSEDLATDSVIELVRKYPTFLIELQYQYTTFLHDVVKKNYLDAVRAAQRRPTISLPPSIDAILPAPDESVEDAALREERLNNVWEIVRTMNTRGRMMLFQVAGWITVDEARHMLGLSRSEYFRQRDQLLKELGRRAS